MNRQLSKSNAGPSGVSATGANILGGGGGGGLQNGKHKVNLSADINLAGSSIPQVPLGGQGNGKAGMGYDRFKGLTPVSSKSGHALKNSFHL